MGWKSVELSKLVVPERGISYGIVQPGAAVRDGVPIIRVSDVRGERIATSSPLRVSPEVERAYTRTRLKGGELLVTIVGTVGETAIVPSELAGWNVARAIAVLPIRKDVGAYWVQLGMRSAEAASVIQSRLNTTVQATLNLGDLAKLPILLPPPKERERIAAVLSTLDHKIDVNRRMNETLEAMARSIFKDWFVDVGPTRAKMEGCAPYLAPDLWALFPDRLDEEGKPVGWTAGCLGDVAQNCIRSCQPKDIAPGTAYIALEHMPRRSIALDRWGNADEVESNKLSFRRGEFLFGKLRPYFHKVGIAPVDGVCTTDAVVVGPKTPQWASFVLMTLSSDEFVGFTDQGSTGTKMPRTSWREMSRFPITRPSSPGLATALNDAVMPMADRLIANIHETHGLAATRDLLLPKLMSGEIRVRDAEKVLEAVA